jgi:phosphatidate cytidylyltransferase
MIFDGMTQFQQRFVISSITTCLMLVIVFFSATPAFKPVFILVFAGIIGCAMWEYYQIALAKGLAPAQYFGIACGLVYTAAVALSTQDPSWQVLPQAILFLSLVALFLIYFARGKLPLVNVPVTFFGVGYLAVPLSCMIQIAYFFTLTEIQDGRWWIFYLLCVTKMTDTGGYFSGKKWGRVKMSPFISPKKTWEGAAGGLFTGVITSVILCGIVHFFSIEGFGLTLWQSVWLGLILSIFAQCGDLAESLLKRDAGVKDSNQLPGLGGVLDIIDSLIFTAPLMYIFLKINYP